MWIRYGACTATGPIRPHNEDAIGVWHPSDEEARRARGTVIVLADGVGGYDAGEVASRLAVDVCMREFAMAGIGLSPNRTLWRMFTAANLAVFDAMLSLPGESRRMATTLTAAIFRNQELTVGHVGDCRAYLLRNDGIRRITNDHSYAGVQLKLGLITVDEAAASANRGVLTRTVGQDAFIQVDYHRLEVKPGDRYMQCCDGVHTFLTEGEIHRIVMENQPQDAAEALIEAALRRGGDDNLSAQVVQIERLERRTLYRGLESFEPVAEKKMGTDIEVGDLVDGRFQMTDLISRSGMAQIFKATDLESQRPVVLKAPLMQFESDPGFYSRFEREEQIGLKLHHPYIIRIEPIDFPKSRPYIVMEYLEGQTLAHLMRTVRPFPERDAARIIARVCEALHYMHGHDVVHRDMKPDNIMICTDGSIRIMDFGIAKFEGMRRLTFGGFTPAMGTPDYMAPEQVKGKRGDKRTDIYSVGAILYEMVTGRTPFEGANPFIIINARLTGDPAAPRSINPELSPQIEEIILHAMSREPSDRYDDALEMAKELKEPDKVHITGRAERLVTPRPWKSRWSSTRLYILAGCIPIVIFLIIWLVSHLRWK